ncbi:MAG: class I SAM-dependent methyltransferase [bacterium]
MKSIEKWLISNSIREYLWNRFEFPIVKAVIEDKIPKKAKCLEIGTGTGIGAISLVKAFPQIEIIATDFDSLQLQEAGKKIRSVKLEDKIGLEQADATNLPFPDASFDFVFAFEVLHHVVEYQKVMKEVFRVLKEGGSFFVAEIPKEVFKYVKLLFPPEVTFSKDELLNLLKEVGFKINMVRDVGKGIFFYILAKKYKN